MPLNSLEPLPRHPVSHRRRLLGRSLWVLGLTSVVGCSGVASDPRVTNSDSSAADATSDDQPKVQAATSADHLADVPTLGTQQTDAPTGDQMPKDVVESQIFMADANSSHDGATDDVRPVDSIVDATINARPSVLSVYVTTRFYENPDAGLGVDWNGHQELLAGFKVELTPAGIADGSQLTQTCLADRTGTCRINNLPPGTYNLWIRQNGFLARPVPQVQIPPSSTVQIGTPVDPIELVPGDLAGPTDEGFFEQDGVVDTYDLKIVQAAFGLTATEVAYRRTTDLDRDGAITMNETMLIAGHMGQSSSQYERPQIRVVPMP